MKEHRPFPEIARLPREPKLPGVPHRAKDSVFSEPGMVDALGLITDAYDLNARNRRNYVEALAEKLGDDNDQWEAVIQALDGITDGTLTDNLELQSRSAFMVDTLKRFTAAIEESPGRDLKDQSLNHLAQTEEFGATLECFADWDNASGRDRDQFLANIVGGLWPDPESILREAVNLNVILDVGDKSGVGEERLNEIARYSFELEKRLTHLADRANPKQVPIAELQNWLRVYCLAGFQPIAEKFLANWVQQTEDVDIIVRRIYEIVTAGATTNNPELMDQAMKIAELQSQVMPPDSPQAIEYLYAAGSASREEYRLFMDVRDAAKFMLRVNKDLRRTVFKGRAIGNKVMFGQAGKKFRRENKLRLAMRWHGQEREIEAAHRRPQLFGIRDGVRRMVPSSPDRDDTDMGESLLRRWMNEGIARGSAQPKITRKGELTGEIQMPGTLRVLKGQVDDLAGVAKQAISRSERGEYELPANWRTLALLVPEGMRQHHAELLERYNEVYRQQIRDRRLRGLSRRGDLIVITDPVLKKLGFRSIEVGAFEDPHKPLPFKVEVEGRVFSGRLSRDYRLLHPEFNSALRLLATGAFLEHVWLAHIHELQCAEVEEDASEEETEWKRQFFSRRDHRRRLPVGSPGPSEQQVLKAWYDYGVDLETRNRERIANGEDRLITWVSHVSQIDIAGTGPVRSYGKTATDRMHRILA